MAILFPDLFNWFLWCGVRVDALRVSVEGQELSPVVHQTLASFRAQPVNLKLC